MSVDLQQLQLFTIKYNSDAADYTAMSKEGRKKGGNTVKVFEKISPFF